MFRRKLNQLDTGVAVDLVISLVTDTRENADTKSHSEFLVYCELSPKHVIKCTTGKVSEVPFQNRSIKQIK